MLYSISELTDNQLKSIDDIHKYVNSIRQSNALLTESIDLNASMCFDSYIHDSQLAIKTLEYDVFIVALKDYYKLHYQAVNVESEGFNEMLKLLKRYFSPQMRFVKPKPSIRLCQMLMSNLVNEQFETLNRTNVYDVLKLGFDAQHLMYSPASIELSNHNTNEQLWFQLLLNSTQAQRLIYDEAKRTLNSIASKFERYIRSSIELVNYGNKSSVSLYDLLFRFSQGNSTYNYSMLSNVIPLFKFTNYAEALKVISWFDMLTPLSVSRTDLHDFWLIQKQDWMNISNMLERIQTALVEVKEGKRSASTVPVFEVANVHHLNFV